MSGSGIGVNSERQERAFCFRDVNVFGLRETFGNHGTDRSHVVLHDVVGRGNIRVLINVVIDDRNMLGVLR
jgi:hypothetical protein